MRQWALIWNTETNLHRTDSSLFIWAHHRHWICPYKLDHVSLSLPRLITRASPQAAVCWHGAWCQVRLPWRSAARAGKGDGWWWRQCGLLQGEVGSWRRRRRSLRWRSAVRAPEGMEAASEGTASDESRCVEKRNRRAVMVSKARKVVGLELKC
jgi:hypothetical protein